MRKLEEISRAFAPTDSLQGKSSFFLVGIGGAGMSALARMLATRGFEVQGTDAVASPAVESLGEEGIRVRVGHSIEGLAESNVDGLILTDAIDLEASPEVKFARENQIPIYRRSQVLGFLLRSYRVLAVTGTHGKTTTTGLLGAALIAAGLDPLVVVGAAIPEWGGPVREGAGEFAVVEACEAYDSFHDLQPYLVLLTNLELDHVDFHGSYERLRESVVRFTNSMGPDGALVYCADDRGASEVAEHTNCEVVGYGRSETWLTQIANKFGVNLRIMNLMNQREVALPGEHNQLNASGALLTCAVLSGRSFDISLEMAYDGLSKFHGAERRLQTIYDQDIKVVDDYAHHPTEIEASLTALKDQGRRLVVVFQPHLYSRTAPLIGEFAKALSLADLVVITDIYPAREEPMPGVSSARIAELVTAQVRYVPSRYLLPKLVARCTVPGDVVVGMGAGNISEFGPAFVNEWKRASHPTRKKRVAVVYGGDSAEREVSIHSGRAVHAALTRSGYDSFLVDISERLLSGQGLRDLVGSDRPDAAFLAVHGTHMEDGAMQGLFELLAIPYTGSGIQASAIAMNKAATKKVLQQYGIQVPMGVLLKSPSEEIPFGPPYIVKPNAQGSTVGLSFVERAQDLSEAIRNAFAYGDEVLVEEWITGTEISTPVLIDKPLLPVEISPSGGKYDFASKYLPGATEEICPARLEPPLLRKAQEIALQCHEALGCKGATRTDAIVRGQEVFVLEVNTLPGLTCTSLMPTSAAACGIPFDQLCELILQEALGEKIEAS